MPRLKSEFGDGGHKSGEISAVHANEKARIQRRMEIDPDTETVDLDVPHDKWKHGGIPEHNSPNWWLI